MFLSFSYVMNYPLRNEVHSARHLVVIFGQENYSDKMLKRKNIYTLQIKNTEGSEAQISTLLSYSLRYKTVSSTQSMSLCQHILASRKPCLPT